jgi:hypothetical protein
LPGFQDDGGICIRIGLPMFKIGSVVPVSGHLGGEVGGLLETGVDVGIRRVAGAVQDRATAAASIPTRTQNVKTSAVVGEPDNCSTKREVRAPDRANPWRVSASRSTITRRR